MAHIRNIDDSDASILTFVQNNARMAQVDIARQVGLAPSAVLERLRKLERDGVIQGYTALIDPRVLGLGLLAFVAVRSDETCGEDRVAKALARLPEILEVHHVAGEDCYLLKVRARDAAHLGEMLRTRIGRVPGVRSTRTTVVLETVKETPRLPIARAADEEEAAS